MYIIFCKNIYSDMDPSSAEDNNNNNNSTSSEINYSKLGARPKTTVRNRLILQNPRTSNKKDDDFDLHRLSSSPPPLLDPEEEDTDGDYSTVEIIMDDDFRKPMVSLLNDMVDT